MVDFFLGSRGSEKCQIIIFEPCKEERSKAGESSKSHPFILVKMLVILKIVIFFQFQLAIAIGYPTNNTNM